MDIDISAKTAIFPIESFMGRIYHAQTFSTSPMKYAMMDLSVEFNAACATLFGPRKGYEMSEETNVNAEFAESAPVNSAPIKEENKISEALDLLEEAAKEKKDDITEMLASKYANLREAIVGASKVTGVAAEDAAARAKEALGHAYDVSREKVKQTADVVDAQVHSTPWPFVGGVALLSLMFGYILGRKQ